MSQSDGNAQSVGAVSDLLELVKQAIENDTRYTLIAPSDQEVSTTPFKKRNTFNVRSQDGDLVELSLDIAFMSVAGRDGSGKKRKPLSVELREARNGRVLPLLEPGKPRFNDLQFQVTVSIRWRESRATINQRAAQPEVRNETITKANHPDSRRFLFGGKYSADRAR